MENAGKFYEKVAAVPEVDRSSASPLYKKGWVRDQPRQLQERARDLRQGHRAVPEAGKIPKNQAGPLEKEAKKDFVKAYARPRRQPRQGLGLLPEDGRRLRAQDDRVPGRALLGTGHVRRVVEGLPQDHHAQRGLAASVRVAEQDSAQHPLGREQEGPGPGAQAPGQRLRGHGQEGGRQEGRHGRVQELLPRHRQGAGADLAQGSAADQERGHLPTGGHGLQGVPRATSATRRTRPRSPSTTARSCGRCNLEGGGRDLHQGRRARPQGQVRQGVRLRGRAGVEERAQHRRRRAKAVDKEQAARRRTLEAAPDPRVPEEDDRRLRHVHQVRAGCARAGEDQVPQGAHLLRLQPLRRGHQAVRGHRRPSRQRRARHLLGEPAARLPQHHASATRSCSPPSRSTWRTRC